MKKFNILLRIPRSVFLIALFLTAHCSLLTAQRSIDLTKREPEWYTVIGGNAVSPCIETSYGVALLSDGRLLSACTNAGNVIWQRSIRGRPSKFITPFGDFLFVVTDNSRLNLVNPSGMTLWTSVCPFQITDFPLLGRDGRVFVRGKKGLACYGLDGKRKWKETTADLGDFPLGQLDDGSILVFLKNPKNGCTVANRYSPFGEKLEDITFSGIVSSVENCEKGVLVSLKNGSIGLVAKTDDGTADSKWVNGTGNTNGAFKICYSPASENTAFFFQIGNKTEAVIVKTENGELQNRFQVGAIASKDFRLARATNDGFFITGIYSACEFTENGTILFTAKLPPAKNWSEIFYTRENYLILCQKDWTMKSYLLSGTPSTTKKIEKDEEISYVSTVKFDQTALDLGIRPLTTEKMAEISKKFETGDYGKDEAEFLPLLKTEAENYLKENATQAIPGQQSSKFFSENALYTQNLLYLMSKTGTREFSVMFARLLSSEIDRNQILSVINFAAKIGYDEKGMILAAIEKLLMGKNSPTDSTILKAICDTTYEICRFMGRPALNKRGKGIITYMMMPQYDKNIQDYARKTLTKLIDLEKKR